MIQKLDLFVMRRFIVLAMILFITSTIYANPQVINLTNTTSSKVIASNSPINAISLNHQIPKANQNNSLDVHLYQTAHQYGINPLLIKAIIKAESNYQANAHSPKGALGLMQVLPSTAAQYGNYNLFDPKDNITVGTRHFAYLMNKYQGQVHLALAAYNAGEGNVTKYGGIPPFSETRQYIIKVSKYYQNLHSDESLHSSIAQEKNHQQVASTQDDAKNMSSKPPPQKPAAVLIINLN